MPLFKICRIMPGVTPEELQSAALRAAFCTYAFNGEVTWIRSYFDPARSEVLCIYEARTRSQIQEHSDLAALPCDEIDEVVEILSDPFYDEAGAEGIEPATSGQP